MSDVLRFAIREGIRAALVDEIAQVVKMKTTTHLKMIIENAIDAAEGQYETAFEALIEKAIVEALKPESAP